ncbi:MAG: hypothetical protein ACK4TB_14755 [Gemmobacter sp.]
MPPAAARPSPVTALRHGRYVVKARGGMARAFLHDARQGSGVMAEATAATDAAAIAAVTAALDSRDAERLAARRMHPAIALPIPTAAEYAEALAVVAPTAAQTAMLRAHAAAGTAGLTATELADAAGFRGYSAANLQYGLLGRAVAEHLSLTLPPLPARGGQHAATWALAEPGPDMTPETPEARFRWVIHPELAAAVASLP